MKENGIIAGLNVAREVFLVTDPSLETEILLADGASVKSGDIALTVTGRVQSILRAERLVLNIMQRMSGIATATATYVAQNKRHKGTHYRYTEDHTRDESP